MSDHEGTNTGEADELQGDTVPDAACPSFETLSAYVDGELAEPEMKAVAAHVQDCVRCQLALDDIGLISALMVNSPVPVPTRTFGIPVRPVEVAAPAAKAPVSLSRRRNPVYRSLPFMTAIAAILLLAVIGGDFSTHQPVNAPVAGDSSPNVLVIDGTPYSREDESQPVQAVGIVPTANAGASSNTPTSQDIAASSRYSSPFWSVWRVVELVLVLVIVGLLITMATRKPLDRG